MKTAICLFCVLCASAAVAQNVGSYTGALSNEPIRIVVPDHPEHAGQKSMLAEQSLLLTSNFTFAHGERPLWEFAPASIEVPLGDVARALRKEHDVVKKSATVVEN